LSLADKLEALRSPGASGSDYKKLGVPEDWRPRMDIDSDKGGYLISSPRPEGSSFDAEAVIREFGLDPAEWRVSSLRRGKWQKFDGEFLESTRVNLLPAASAKLDSLDLEKLMDEMKKWRPEKGTKTATLEDTLQNCAEHHPARTSLDTYLLQFSFLTNPCF